MPEQGTLGWRFKSGLTLEEMQALLSKMGVAGWSLGDSERLGDYLGGRLTEEAVGRIYKVKDGYVVNLRFFSKEGDAAAQLGLAKKRLLEEILPAVSARDVKAAEPLD